MEEVVEFGEAYLQLLLGEFGEPVDVPLEYFAHAQEFRAAAFEHNRPRRDGLLAVRECVERGDGLFLAGAGLELEFYAHRLARQVVYLADLHLLLLYGVLDGSGEGVGGFAPRQFRYHEPRLVLLLDAGSYLDLPEAVLVVRGVHDAAELEVWIELERLFLKDGDFALEEFDEIVRQDGS